MSQERFRGGALMAAASVVVLACSSCASVGDPAVWADGEVRDLHSFRPIQGAVVSIEYAGPRAESTRADRTDQSGHFAVFQSLDEQRRRIRLVAVADGYKPAEFSLLILQSNTLRIRLAAVGSSKESRIEVMPTLPEESDGSDDSSGSH